MTLDVRHRGGTRDAHARAVARVIAAMRERLGDNMSLGEMARVAYMSRYHFDRTFRDVTGVRPRQYLRALRLEAAKRLLIETSSSVTDVCFDVGYTSLGTFVRSFTRLLGVSPRRLRSLAHRDHGPLLDQMMALEVAPGGSVVSGRVAAPADFSGHVLVGLFAAAIPQGAPLACAVAVGDGRYRLCGLREGTYYLFALGVPRATSPKDLVLGEATLRAGGHAIEVHANGAIRVADLSLRPPLPLDPPLLIAVTALARRLATLGTTERECTLAAAG